MDRPDLLGAIVRDDRGRNGRRHCATDEPATRLQPRVGFAWSLASTPSEVVGFIEALFGGGLISDDSLREMLAMVPIGPGEHHAYGLGLMGDVDPHRPVGHNGGGPWLCHERLPRPRAKGPRRA